MDLFDVLTLIGGLSLFLFGMNIMGQALERKAGNKLKDLLAKMTNSKFKGFLTGLVITTVIQSSSATTVMVVGFVNSGLMTLRQAINVIMGANIGTTITSWILSLGDIDGSSILITLLKPTSFTPILALVGIIFYMFLKDDSKKDIGSILLGFATLMFGMDTMSNAVSGLANVPGFSNLFILFTNPLLGVLVGALLTAIIQSSSASVGILQALSSTGQVTYGAAVPIIMGQNIGTCVTCLLSSIGTNKNARRAAVVHLLFNTIGTVVILTLFCIIKTFVYIPLLSEQASMFGIALTHSIFNVLCVMILLPMSALLEKLALRIIPDDKIKEKYDELDTRLFVTPTLALAQAKSSLSDMADTSRKAITMALKSVNNYSDKLYEDILKQEDKNDRYEDKIGTYLVDLSSKNNLSESESKEVSKMLKIIGDLERIADHAINIGQASRELRDKNLSLSEDAIKEMDNMLNAVKECVDLSLLAFEKDDLAIALKVPPLEEVIDELKAKLRANHIDRVKRRQCSIEAGFIWSDLLTNLERVGDHCNNIATDVIDDLNYDNRYFHKTKRHASDDEGYDALYRDYSLKYGNLV
ncbi:MAG: Na/Pi cotransporter family protein [Solobacterium sp.]|nr:Na/Pi cotransporter family protein [Solobacterium sp.]MDY4791972.1 Na/Pi cotransporter family protein [Erysipelotrichaceae bacterium]MCI6877970.1 Na/Pi cotransporter family protein [Solobacterium sp.]MCI7157408.1 Na/Pi cotransporter family protein [Solobacterium sp.]MCI7446445.1 Na/Pi cotransporter family protein [Solobacterium sp.]